MIKYSVILLLLMLSGKAVLLGQSRYEYTVYGGGGLSTLVYDLELGEQKNGFGGLLGGGVFYALTERFSVGTGLEFSIYTAKADIDSYSERYMAQDIAGDLFEYRFSMHDYSEEQRALLLNIPLTGKYKFGYSKEWYVAGGFKIGIPLQAKYEIKKNEIRTSGYYEEENCEYTDVDFMGFGTYNNLRYKDNFKLKMSYTFSVEAGRSWLVKDRTRFYVALYADYGLNDILKDKRNTKLIDYNREAPQDAQLNSVLTSNIRVDKKDVVLSDKLSVMAVGVKIGLSFTSRKQWACYGPIL